MELDQLKTNWNNLHQQQNELSTHTINKIMMNTTTTINQLQQKNQYWNNLAKVIFPVLIVVLIINLIIGSIAPAQEINIFSRISYTLIMIIFAVVSLYMYRWQESIFAYYNSGDLKASLAKTIKEFKRFYLLSNLTYLILFPVYFYAMFKLLIIVIFHLSENTILISCAVLSILSIIGNYIYYRLTYFKRIRLLEASLHELDS